MVVVFYNDDAGRLEQTVFQTLRWIGVQQERNVYSCKKADYDLFSFNTTSIRFYRKSNSIGSVSIRIEIEGLQEDSLKKILEARLGAYLKEETRKR